MAKAKQYFEKMFKESGLDDATTSAILAAFDNEKLNPQMEQLVKIATEDYQAQIGRVNALTAKQGEYENWYQKVNPQYQAALAELEAYKNKSNGDPGMNDNFDASKYVSKDDLLAAQREMGNRFGGLLKQVTKIAGQHAIRFQEALDTDAIEAIAAKDGLPVEAAYEKWIAPRVAEAQKADIEKRIKEAREDERRQVLSTHKLPVDPTPRQVGPLYQKAAEASGNIDDELLAAWNGQA